MMKVAEEKEDWPSPLVYVLSLLAHSNPNVFRVCQFGHVLTKFESTTLVDSNNHVSLNEVVMHNTIKAT